MDSEQMNALKFPVFLPKLENCILVTTELMIANHLQFSCFSYMITVGPFTTTLILTNVEPNKPWNQTEMGSVLYRF